MNALSPINRYMLTFCSVFMLVACAGYTSTSTDSESKIADSAFSQKNDFARDYQAASEVSCEAARRALLSQAYLIMSSSEHSVTASKHFQQTRDDHYEIEFSVTCAPRLGEGSTVFVSAMQQMYTMRKRNTNASLGVSLVGTLSVPIKSSNDSLVKTGSVTLTQPSMYKQFFTLLESYLISSRPATQTAEQVTNPNVPVLEE